MSVKFDVNLTWQELFRFNVYQTYTSFQGFVGILMPVIIFVIAGITFSEGACGYGALYIIGGIVVLLYLPFTLYTRARATMKKNTVLANTLHFTLTEQSIGVTQGEESGELPWDQVYKLVVTKRQVLIYSSRVNAYIIPLDQLGVHYDTLRGIAEKALPKYRLRLRRQ